MVRPRDLHIEVAVVAVDDGRAEALGADVDEWVGAEAGQQVLHLVGQAAVHGDGEARALREGPLDHDEVAEVVRGLAGVVRDPDAGAVGGFPDLTRQADDHGAHSGHVGWRVDGHPQLDIGVGRQVHDDEVGSALDRLEEVGVPVDDAIGGNEAERLVIDHAFNRIGHDDVDRNAVDVQQGQAVDAGGDGDLNRDLVGILGLGLDGLIEHAPAVRRAGLQPPGAVCQGVARVGGLKALEKAMRSVGSVAPDDSS
ncbi:hypothetical protein D3C72_1165760 [compost metagenome]